MLDWGTGAYLLIIGAVSAMVGSFGIGYLLDKVSAALSDYNCNEVLTGCLLGQYNRQSLIIFPVAGVIGASTVLMGYTSSMQVPPPTPFTPPFPLPLPSHSGVTNSARHQLLANGITGFRSLC
jgi:hypothetical protein